MKKFVLSTLMAVALISSASAQTYKFLILQDQTGSKTGMLLQGLKLTFSGDLLTALQDGKPTTFPISSLQKMFFSATETGIKSIGNDNAAFSLDGSTLTINAPAGTIAKVYDTKGRMVMSTKVTTDGKPALINTLQPGIYVVKAAQTSLKFIVK